MSFEELTDEQRAFAEHPSEVFVKACPGAGKTHTVLARTSHIGQSLPPRKGIALLSFTNSAVDEFKERSLNIGLRSIFNHPGFIGTFDSFIRTFIFLPQSENQGVKAQVVDSWSTLDAEVRLSGRQAHSWGVGLDCFDPVTGEVRLGYVDYRSQDYVRANRAQYQTRALSYIRSLNGKGYYSVEQVRRIVLERVRNTQVSEPLGRALSARFFEIIVDEAQDCNPDDLEILTWLRSYGVRITMVCDLDQSIYTFRGGDQSALEDFADTYEENTKNINGNFRCSPAICLLAASLRTSGNPDESIGKTQNVTHPIVIIPYSGQIDSRIGVRFLDYITTRNDAETLSKETVVLAHARANACKASGGLVAPPSGQSRVEKMAFAIKEFWTPEATRVVRRKAIDSVEKLMLDYLRLRESDQPVEKAAEEHDINLRVLRRHSIGVIMSLEKHISDGEESRNVWVNSLREAFERLDFKTINTRQSARRFFTMPRNNNWAHYLTVDESETGLTYATIHQAKGREYTSVCVVLPPDRGISTRTEELITTWQRSTPFEAKNVIYVGVTRAQFLTALAIPQGYVDQCVGILDSSGVPYELVD